MEFLRGGWLLSTFRKDVLEAANDIRNWSKKQSQNWNQHSRRRFDSKTFSWPTTEKEWRMPEIKQERLSVTEYLRPFYARVKMFLPDRTMGHHLPRGRMPCKWHGYEGDCCVRDSVFCPSGPRACHASDGSVTYIFSSRFCCSTRRDEAAAKRVSVISCW
jgi:hypothetical protein